MATTKKPSAKKPVAKSTKTRAASTAKVSTKSPVKKAPAKRAASKTSKASKSAPVRSFRRSSDELPFTTFRVTRQTLYWVVLVSFIIFAQLWIISLQVDVATLLDAQQAQLQDF